MKLHMICVLVLALAALSACSSAQKKTAAPAQTQASTPAPVMHDTTAASADPEVVKKEMCEDGKDKRALEVRKTTRGCELSYSKWGKASVVSSSKHGLKHCEDSLDKIEKKLEADKFKCG